MVELEHGIFDPWGGLDNLTTCENIDECEQNIHGNKLAFQSYGCVTFADAGIPNGRYCVCSLFHGLEGINCTTTTAQSLTASNVYIVLYVLELLLALCGMSIFIMLYHKAKDSARLQTLTDAFRTLGLMCVGLFVFSFHLFTKAMMARGKFSPLVVSMNISAMMIGMSFAAASLLVMVGVWGNVLKENSHNKRKTKIRKLNASSTGKDQSELGISKSQFREIYVACLVILVVPQALVFMIQVFLANMAILLILLALFFIYMRTALKLRKKMFSIAGQRAKDSSSHGQVDPVRRSAERIHRFILWTLFCMILIFATIGSLFFTSVVERTTMLNPIIPANISMVALHFDFALIAVGFFSFLVSIIVQRLNVGLSRQPSFGSGSSSSVASALSNRRSWAPNKPIASSTSS